MFDKQVDNARANLSMTNVSKFLIPIPPIVEQERIVARIDQLMALCDNLEQSITAASGSRTALLNAMMAKVWESDYALEICIYKPIQES